MEKGLDEIGFSGQKDFNPDGTATLPFQYDEHIGEIERARDEFGIA